MNTTLMISPALSIPHLLCKSSLSSLEAISASPSVQFHIFTNLKWCISGPIGCCYINPSNYLPLGLWDHYLRGDFYMDIGCAHYRWFCSRLAVMLMVSGHALLPSLSHFSITNVASYIYCTSFFHL